jgi:hypothetical protein
VDSGAYQQPENSHAALIVVRTDAHQGAAVNSERDGHFFQKKRWPFLFGDRLQEIG